MCCTWVRRIIKRDKNKIFRFAPLNGESAKKLLSPVLPDYLQEDTIVYYDNGRVHIRSNAVLQIFETLGYHFLSPARIIPTALRDKVYAWVAARRYKFGPRYDSCPLPPEEWKDRFLD